MNIGVPPWRAVRQGYLHYAALMRQLRQTPDDGYFAKLKPLAEMVLLDASNMEKMTFRDLARKVLGRKATEGSVDRLARKYSEHLRGYPATDHRFDGLVRELLRKYAVRTALENALVLAREGVTKG